MARVDLRKIRKTYAGNVEAVKGVDLGIEDGELLVLVGPSGCGKSTTLRLVAGLEDLDDGEILIGERCVNDVEPKDRDIAMVFQNYALYPHMSVYKNMAFGLKLRKYSKKEIDARVREAAEILGIGELLNRKPKALSGGQRQRVAVGRAIVRQPSVFLFDEPLSNLDALLRVQMRAELGRLHARLGTTMIYVTHDQVEAMTLGTRIAVMHEGHLQQVATPQEIYETPANRFVAGFIGSPPMNLIDATTREVDGQLRAFGPEEVFSVVVPSGIAAQLDSDHTDSIVIGIRPEHLISTSEQDEDAMPGEVQVVEPLGAETHVYMDVRGQTLIARLDPDTTLRPGDRAWIRPDPERLKFFDPNSGDALPH